MSDMRVFLGWPGPDDRRDLLIERYSPPLPGSGPSADPDAQPQFVPVNVFESADNLVVFVPMPGLQASDITLTLGADGVLSVRGKKRGHEERHRFLRHEWTVGPYEREVRLPDDLDPESARATLDNGVLVVSFNRAQGSMPHRIPITAGS